MLAMRVARSALVRIELVLMCDEFAKFCGEVTLLLWLHNGPAKARLARSICACG
jgi:hypothetical protein